MFGDGYKEIGSGNREKSAWKMVVFIIIFAALCGIVVAEYYETVYNILVIEEGSIVTLPASNIEMSSVTFNGHSEVPATVWFEWGLKGGGWAFKTDKMELGAAGNFSYNLKSPLLYGDTTYKYRAMGIALSTNETLTGNTEEFTMASVPEVENKNLSKYYNNLNKANLTPAGLTTAILGVWTDKLGALFWVLLIGLPFLIMFITETNITIPSVIALAAGGALFKYLPDEWRYVAYILLVVGIAGITFAVFKSKKR